MGTKVHYLNIRYPVVCMELTPGNLNKSVAPLASHTPKPINRPSSVIALEACKAICVISFSLALRHSVSTQFLCKLGFFSLDRLVSTVLAYHFDRCSLTYCVMGTGFVCSMFLDRCGLICCVSVMGALCSVYLCRCSPICLWEGLCHSLLLLLLYSILYVHCGYGFLWSCAYK